MEYCLEVELMFSDLVVQGGPEKFQSSSSLREIDPNVEFKSVSTRKYNLRRLSDGIFEYVPVVFEEQHFCVSLCTVHSSLLNFQFRVKPLRHYTKEVQEITTVAPTQNADKSPVRIQTTKTILTMGSADDATLTNITN